MSIRDPPASLGGNSLGADDGRGHATNPATGQPYAPELVPVSDFGRVLAEHWADGPKSETPPGHWNVIANHVSDDPRLQRRLFVTGAAVGALEWDVKTYFVLNGALHDAAVAAWEIKRRFDSVRPISLIRYMAARGQRSESAAPDYAADGLPPVRGLIERIGEESAAPGGRHEHLRHFRGELALRSWRGEPGDLRGSVGGVGWIRAAEWLPYQRRNFVTPAARFDSPAGLAWSEGEQALYVTDSGGHTIRRLDTAAQRVSTWLGDPSLSGGFAGSRSFREATLYFPAAPVIAGGALGYRARRSCSSEAARGRSTSSHPCGFRARLRGPSACRCRSSAPTIGSSCPSPWTCACHRRPTRAGPGWPA